MQKYGILILLRLSVNFTLIRVCNKIFTKRKKMAIFKIKKTLYYCVEF